MWVLTPVVPPFGRYRTFRGTRIGLLLPTSDWTQTRHLSSVRTEQAMNIYFHSSCDDPDPVEESPGSLGIWRISRSAALSCRSLFVPHWSLSVRLSGDGLKVWPVLPLWPGPSVHPGLLPWLQGHLSGRVYKARSMLIRNDLFFSSVKRLIGNTANKGF